MRKTFIAQLTVFLCLAAISVPVLSQYIQLKKSGDRNISCVRSGLSSSLKRCDTQPESNESVFIANIAVIASLPNHEYQLSLVPEEIFLGKPSAALEVRTSQSECGPVLKVGDRWLFAIGKLNQKGEKRTESEIPVIDLFSGQNEPVEQAAERIATLRELQTVDGQGILRGRAVSGLWWQGNVKPLADAEVSMRPIHGGRRVSALSDAEGRYDFHLIPSETYDVQLRSPDGRELNHLAIRIGNSSCWDMTLQKRLHTVVRGSVRDAHGKPVALAPVVLAGKNIGVLMSGSTNADGEFEFDEVQPGRYIAGVNPPGASTQEPAGSVQIPSMAIYYGQSVSPGDASMIDVRQDEETGNVDMVLP